MKKTLYILVILLSGCSLYKAPKVEPITIPKNFKENLRVNNHHLETSWWKNFHDNNLNILVNKAIENNLNYQIALSNIKVAQTYVSESIVKRIIDVNIGANAERIDFTNGSISAYGFTTHFNPKIKYHNLYGSASYEADIWNQKGNVTSRARVDTQVREADSRAVQLTLISEVVNTYFQIATLNGLIINLTQQFDSADQSLKITTAQHQSGFINTTFINSAKSNKELIRSNIYDLRKQRKLYLNHLAYLLGEYPEKFYYNIKPLPSKTHFNSMLPPSVPAEVLGNRPDIQKAFLEILSYDYLKKETLANFLPIVPLYAGFNNEGVALANITQKSLLLIYGVSVSEQLTKAIANISEYKRTKIYYEQAGIHYKDTVLNAFQEVNNALLSYNEDYKSLNTIQSIVDNYSAQLQTAKDQYRAGAINYHTYLQVKLALQQNTYTLQTQKMLVYKDIIQIYKVLGLGVNKQATDPAQAGKKVNQNQAVAPQLTPQQRRAGLAFVPKQMQ